MPPARPSAIRVPGPRRSPFAQLLGLILVSLVLLGVAACAGGTGPEDRAEDGREDAERFGLPGVQTPAPLASCPTTSEVQVVERARGLEVPWAMASLPDGRILVTERPGRIRVLDPDLQAEPWTEPWTEPFPVAALEEAGLMGIAAHPEVASNGYVYVVGLVDRRQTQGWLEQQVNRVRVRLGDEGARPWVLRVWRLTDVEGRGTDLQVVVDAIVSNPLHAGGALLAPAADHLLLSVGDGFQPGRARDAADPRGSLVRIPLDPATGLAPAGAGAAAPRVVAMGIRNSQGLALVPAMAPGSASSPSAPSEPATLFFMDHGPTGLDFEGNRRGKDELNVLEGPALGGEAGGGGGPADFGWPLEAGVHEPATFRPPLAVWSPALAPAGLALRVLPVNGAAAPSAAPNGIASPMELWITGLRGEALLRLEVEPAADAGWTVVCEERVNVADGAGGATPNRFRAVLVTDDGRVLVSTSNRDGRGVPGEGDDRILELRWNPADSPPEG